MNKKVNDDNQDCYLIQFSSANEISIFLVQHGNGTKKTNLLHDL